MMPVAPCVDREAQARQIMMPAAPCVLTGRHRLGISFFFHYATAFAFPQSRNSSAVALIGIHYSGYLTISPHGIASELVTNQLCSDRVCFLVIFVLEALKSDAR